MNLDILKSKKFQAMILGIAISIICHLLGLEPGEIVTFDSPILAYIISQGVADHGKEKEKAKTNKI